jgi:hypothetical protein
MSDETEIESVSAHLLKDHSVILSDLDSFKWIRQSDRDEWARRVKEVKFSLSRHLYLEEKAVFMYCELINLINTDVTSRIFTDHDILLTQLEIIEAENEKDSTKIKKFTLFFKKHIKFEEHEFYPLLDQNITERNKIKFIQFMQKDRKLGYFPIQQMREYAKKHPGEICKD